MEQHINSYLDYIKLHKNLSINTLDAYERDIIKFYKYISSNKETLLTVDEVTVMGYIQNLLSKNISSNSINRNLVTLRNFYKYLVYNHIIPNTPLLDFELPKLQRSTPQILSSEEVEKLLNSPSLNTKKGIRDKAILEIMYATGIKVTELISLEKNDINLDLCYIICKGSKNQERIIPIGKSAIISLKSYFAIRNEYTHNECSVVFLNSKGSPLTRQGLWKIIKEYAKLARIEKDVNLYSLRHSFAIHLLENGADLKIVQELLGHIDLATTQIYMKITKRKKTVEIYNKTHPRA